jgi:hypothetical protein
MLINLFLPLHHQFMVGTGKYLFLKKIMLIALFHHMQLQKKQLNLYATPTIIFTTFLFFAIDSLPSMVPGSVLKWQFVNSLKTYWEKSQ